MVTHYSQGIAYKVDETGWRVESGCGIVLRGTNVTPISDTDSIVLSQVDCARCREIYALEFLAEVP